MRADDLFLLINEIDDALVLEAEGECAVTKNRFPSVEFLAAAACFAALVAVFVIIGIRMRGVPERNCPDNPGVSTTVANAAESISPGAFPYVVVNGTKYFYDDYTPLTELPEGYIAIGTVSSNDSYEGCKVGDIIYRKPGDTSEIFVYTELFNKGNGYWYLRFVHFGEITESTSSAVSKEDVSAEPVEPPMFFKEPAPEDIVYDAENGVSYVKNQLLVSAELGAPEEEMRVLFDEVGAEIVGYIALTNDYQIEFAEDKTLEELQAAADYLNSFSFTQSVTLNLVLETNYDNEDVEANHGRVVGVRYGNPLVD